MKISCCNWIANFAHDDDSSWTAVDAQCASRADIIVNDEQHIVGWIIAWLLGVFGDRDCFRRNHVDALPRTNIDATFTHDAFTLINMNELLWLDGLAKVISIHLNELILS